MPCQCPGQDRCLLEQYNVAELEEILRDNHNDDGSVELDFDEMDNATLWRLDAFVSRHEKAGPPAGLAQPDYEQESDSDAEFENIA